MGRRRTVHQINRRRFLQVATGVTAGLALPELASAAAAYRVGVGSSTDPYAAANRALAASGQFPASAIAGKTVIIKPNLVNTAAPQPERPLIRRSCARSWTRR